MASPFLYAGREAPPYLGVPLRVVRATFPTPEHHRAIVVPMTAVPLR
jgi:hypothetical protein